MRAAVPWELEELGIRRGEMRVEHRGPTSIEEKKEFDQVTFHQIQEIP